ncbi:MAG: TonB-dependent receptor [Methylococcaceae bacterium]|nr:TonB-dependent receptor [Methylococcaceae bacterium]
MGARGPGEELERLPLGRLVEVANLEDLANLVVTGTKLPQAAETVTQNSSELRADDLERHPLYNRNIAEFMRYSSGQFVNVLSRNDANWGSYAGLGPKYNSYLLDGLPIDSFVDPMSLDPWAFERIEVYKGPAAVMYSNYLTMDFAGNESPLAGTTNLVLKDRIDQTRSRVQLGYGSYDTVAGRAYHQGRAGDLSYFAGASEEVSSYTRYGTADSGLYTLDHPQYEKTKFYGKASYAFGRPDHTLSVFAHFTKHDGDLGRPNRDFSHDYGTVNVAYDNRLSDAWHLQFKIGERYYQRKFGNDGWPSNRTLALTLAETTRQRILPVDFTVNFRHWGQSWLTAGVDYQSVDYRTINRSPAGVARVENSAEAESVGLYLQEKIVWHDWVLRAGVRHNSLEHRYDLLGGQRPALDRKHWDATLWSAGLRYNLTPELALYANAGSSFMAPTAKQIGGTVAAPTDEGNLPNPSLRPESGLGKDLGIDWRPTRTLSLGARAFHNEISSAIVDNVLSTQPSQAIAVNAGSVTAMGLELDLRHAPLERFQWFANLTLNHSRVSNPAQPDQDGSAVPFVPEQLANLGFTARLPGELIASPYLHWVGRYWDSTSQRSRRAFGDYALLNLRLQRQMMRYGGASVDLTLDLNNLGNRRFDMPFDFRDPGFNAFAAVDVRF